METSKAQGAQRTPGAGPALSTLVVWCLSLVSVASLVWFQAPADLAAARPGSIRGRVEIKRVAAPVERRPGVADLGTPAGRDVPNLLRSVVYLESAPRGAFETSEGGRAVMD